MDRNGASKVVEQAEVNNLKGEEEEVKVTNGVAKVEKKEKIQWSPINVIWDGLRNKSQKKVQHLQETLRLFCDCKDR